MDLYEIFLALSTVLLYNMERKPRKKQNTIEDIGKTDIIIKKAQRQNPGFEQIDRRAEPWS